MKAREYEFAKFSEAPRAVRARNSKGTKTRLVPGGGKAPVTTACLVRSVGRAQSLVRVELGCKNDDKIVRVLLSDSLG